jgi:ankyrin repeat protein
MTLSGIDDNGESKLHFAAKNGLIDACKVLLENGSDPNFKNKAGNSAFHVALLKGYEDVILLLICYGASPTCRNSEGELPDAIADNVGLYSIAASIRAAARVAMRSSSSGEGGGETISSLQSGNKSTGGKIGNGRDGKKMIQ